MFSAQTAGPLSAAERNPKRRQRTTSDDSVATRHHPKRIRRSALTHETFIAPESAKINGHAKHVEKDSYTNGHAQEPGQSRQGSVDSASLAHRHKGPKRVDRERHSSERDGGVQLVGLPSSEDAARQEAKEGALL